MLLLPCFWSFFSFCQLASKTVQVLAPKTVHIRSTPDPSRRARAGLRPSPSDRRSEPLQPNLEVVLPTNPPRQPKVQDIGHLTTLEQLEDFSPRALGKPGDLILDPRQ